MVAHVASTKETGLNNKIFRKPESCAIFSNVYARNGDVLKAAFCISYKITRNVKSTEATFLHFFAVFRFFLPLLLLKS